MISDRFVLRASYDELEIRAADGTRVRAHVAEPEGVAASTSASASPSAFVIVVPIVRALATDLARRGYRALTFDGRPREDWAVVLECVRERADGLPVIALGPSDLVLPSKADALVFLGGRAWRGLHAALTSSVTVPVAQVLHGLDLPLARLAQGPTHVVRTQGRGESAYGAIAEAIDWCCAQLPPVRRDRTPE